MTTFWVTISVTLEADNVDEARFAAYEIVELGTEAAEVDITEVSVEVDEQ